MSGQRKEFIVVAIGDREAEGFAEEASVRLRHLLDSSAPDAAVFSHIGGIGYYLHSARAIAAVEDVIARAETLRDTDATFSTLGIGLAHGPLLADIDSHGRVDPAFLPVGVVANDASRAVHGMQAYREALAELHETPKT